MAYKVIKGKNKIRGEQTFVDTISGSVISASSYVGGTFNGVTISASLGLFSYVTASAISASTFIGVPDATPKGPEYSLQFNSGSVFSGSANLLFNYVTNTLSGTTAKFSIVSASAISSSVYYGIPDTTPKGIEYSLQFNSGSTFSGSSGLVYNYVTNILSGTTANFTSITASYISGNITNAQTASYSLTASFYDTSSLLITASSINDTITLTKGNGNTFPITINNVVNAQTASYILNAVSSSYASNADLLDGRDSTSFAGLTSNIFVGNQTISGNVDITGIVTANQLYITYTTSSVIYTSGSTKFGDSADDTHQFTGSILAGIVSGTNATFSTITGSLFGTASYAATAGTASYYNTSSLLITASVSNATITFTKGNNTTFPIIINNVTNATSASYATNADLLDNRDSTTFAGTGSNTFIGNQIITGTLNVTQGITGSLFGTASYASSATVFPFSGSAVITGSLTLTGSAGTTIFSSAADTIIFTGSWYSTGSVYLTGTLNVSGSITGTLFGTASFANNCLTASYIDGGFY